MTATIPELDGEGPLWLQVRRALARPILDGSWQPGAKVPAETELTGRYGASRMTVNKALHSLAQDGLVERRRKRGTIVADYTFNVFEREIVGGDSEHGRLHGLGPEARLLWLLVEHFSDAHPVQLEERLINLASAPKAARESFRKTAPSEWLLQQVPWTQAEHAILAREARGRTAKLLQLRPGSACLVVERQTWDGEIPVTFARLWHPGEQHRLVGRFEPRKY